MSVKLQGTHYLIVNTFINVNLQTSFNRSLTEHNFNLILKYEFKKQFFREAFKGEELVSD